MHHQECISAGGEGAEDRVLVRALDVSRYEEEGGFQDAAKAVDSRWGGIDIIIQNAGKQCPSHGSCSRRHHVCCRRRCLWVLGWIEVVMFLPGGGRDG